MILSLRGSLAPDGKEVRAGEATCKEGWQSCYEDRGCARGGDEDVEAVVDLYLVETIPTANIIKKMESKGGMVVML